VDNKKVIVYPYDIEFAPVLRHKDLLHEFDIVGVVSPNGWGFTGKDASCADKGGDLDLSVTDRFDDLLKVCDAVIFAETNLVLDFEKLVYPKICKAAEAGKSILITMKLTEEDIDKISKLCIDYRVDFKYYNSFQDMNKHKKLYIKREELLEITTPVISVLGNSERTNKFEIQLALRENIQKMGYKVSQIGSRSYCELLGFHSFPQFIFEHSLPESYKITLFNHYIKKIEEEEKPDMIILGIPGGIMPFSNSFTSRYGITAYEVCQAVSSDTTVMSVLYEDYKSEYFKMLSDLAKYRFGTNINCFNFSNINFDRFRSEHSEFLIYTTIDTHLIERKKGNLNIPGIPIYNVFNPGDSYKMACSLVDKLAYYGEVETV
jgi:peptide maturation system protein, TIGR04066 family